MQHSVEVPDTELRSVLRKEKRAEYSVKQRVKQEMVDIEDTVNDILSSTLCPDVNKQKLSDSLRECDPHLHTTLTDKDIRLVNDFGQVINLVKDMTMRLPVGSADGKAQAGVESLTFSGTLKLKNGGTFAVNAAATQEKMHVGSMGYVVADTPKSGLIAAEDFREVAVLSLTNIFTAN